MTVQFDQHDRSLITASTPVSRNRRSGPYRRVFKRFFDITVALIAMPFVLPTILLLAGLAAMDGGAPLYRSQRVGRRGRVFGMFKIRTMVPDAPRLLAEHLQKDQAAMAEWESTQKLKHDPRITRFGRFLRKSSLDELPQLWNVLKGDMSLVGPRPMLPEQRGLYPGLAYYELRPGLTGTWQVSERNESTFSKRAEFDRGYFESLSFLGDLNVLARTVSVVLRGTGY